jgi:DNA-binding PadR family transcriptional regulator
MRGGRAKRYYHVSPAGMAILRRVRRMYLALWQGFEAELDGA